ncbi:MAG TPA: IS1595 family transposase, partial [Bacteroidia bacterium]|nr:IS1595 family transposase [Bacteroidia bacterium]
MADGHIKGRKPTKTNFWTVFKLQETFKTEVDCIKHLENILWKDGAYCPYCGNEKIYRFKCQKKYKCATCRQIFSIRVGTIFEDSNLKLTVWYAAIYFISINKRGISSHNLARQLGITQKTAWFMLHRIRFAQERSNLRKPILEGVCQADEVEIGGEERHRKAHIEKYVAKRGKKLRLPPVAEAKGFFDNKVTVAGVISDDGAVVTKVVPNKRKIHLDPFLRENVKQGATLYTDEWYAYQDMKKKYNHHTVNHS